MSLVSEHYREQLDKFDERSIGCYLYLIILVLEGGECYLKLGETTKKPNKRFDQYKSDYRELISIIPMVIWKSDFRDKFIFKIEAISEALLKDVCIGYKKRNELFEYTKENIGMLMNEVSRVHFDGDVGKYIEPFFMVDESGEILVESEIEANLCHVMMVCD